MWLEWRVPACHPKRPLVILSEAKNLGLGTEILRFAQNDTGEPIRLFLSDELMHHLERYRPCIDPRYTSMRGRISMEP